ncbi:three-helix bundle dimerization domain-containing protein [Planctomonas deserti]|jgi:hypothetical protein|uniref:three-helix bundle dimerization domain-containing protein n=1 Tax=Planctomonas deserti TaxID=2144185 RepID=UPI00131ED291|nr:hypothetical protein [Planctomonas deserti]
MVNDASDEDVMRQVAEKLAGRYPDASRTELDDMVREEFSALSGRPVSSYLSILTERAVRKRLKKTGAAAEQ